MESRCLNIFESACRTKATFKTFRNFLDTFLKWSNHDYESLLALQTIDLENRLVDYVIYLKRRSKECRDCGMPLEENPFEVSEYNGDNEPEVFKPPIVSI